LVHCPKPRKKAFWWNWQKRPVSPTENAEHAQAKRKRLLVMSSGVFACFTSSIALFILSKTYDGLQPESTNKQPPNPPWEEAKEKRSQQLEEVRRRRRLIYQLMRKMQPRQSSF
jgi:hypothetical protein